MATVRMTMLASLPYTALRGAVITHPHARRAHPAPLVASSEFGLRNH
jgi:hypothetical protein